MENVLSVTSLLCALIGLLFSTERTKGATIDFIRRTLRRLRLTKKNEKTRGSELVPFRRSLRITMGGDHLQTTFEKPLDEERLMNLALEPGQQTILLGQAGFGKSQFASCFEKWVAKEQPDYCRAFINRGIRCGSKLTQQIAIQLDLDGTNPTALRGNRAVIIIDGLDEMWPEEREEILEESSRWAGYGASVLVTARDINSLPDQYRRDYDTYTIQPLSEERVVEIVEEWCKHTNIGDAKQLKEEVQSLTAKGSLWAPGNNDVALLSPFYLVHTCSYYKKYGRLPPDRLAILEMIVRENLEMAINPALHAAAQGVLLKIAGLAECSANAVSVPRVGEHELRNILRGLAPSLQIDYNGLLDKLLETHLLVKMGEDISFGAHGLIYHFFAARHHIGQGMVSAEDLWDKDRATVELTAAMLDTDAAIRLSEELLGMAVRQFPPDQTIKACNDKINPCLPYFALAAVQGLPIEVVDSFVHSALNRAEVHDGYTRWKVVEMLTGLDQYVRSSKALVAAIDTKKGDIAATLAEVVCWLGHKRWGWRVWVLEELERITKYATDYHPLLHITEAVFRLELHELSQASKLLSELSQKGETPVRFSATAMKSLSSEKGLWDELGHGLLEWIEQKEAEKLPDYILCHGYYCLHWLSHRKFGSHSVIGKARQKVMERVKTLCESQDCPYYWIWYLGRPIISLGLFERCRERLSYILSDPRVPPETKLFVRNFVISQGATVDVGRTEMAWLKDK